MNEIVLYRRELTRQPLAERNKRRERDVKETLAYIEVKIRIFLCISFYPVLKHFFIFFQNMKRVYQERRSKKRNSLEVTRLRRALAAKNQALLRLRNKEKKAEMRKRNLASQQSKKQLLLEMTPFLSSAQMTILEAQLSNVGNKKKHYTDKFKELAISLLFKGTSSYRSLAKKLRLPPVRTVRKWLEHLHFEEGFQDDVFALFEERVKEMSPEDRNVSLLADEISLKEHCDYDLKEDKIYGVKQVGGEGGDRTAYVSHALVLMVSGVRKLWKQAVAYFFTESGMPGQDLQKIIKECISRLTNCGLAVLNVTSDQGGNFTSLLSRLEVTPTKPYFIHENQKIFLLADPPHLLKSARNALLDNDIITTEGKASWAHIRQLFDLEKKGRLKLAPKLTEQHIDPPPIYGKMNVRLAAQVLSRTVATALKVAVVNGLMEESALATSSFCQNVNDIFDMLNARDKTHAYPFKAGLHPASPRMEHLKTAGDWLKSLKIIGKDGGVNNHRFRWINGFLLSLSSVEQLTHHVCSTLEFEYLLTRRLCQDSLENYFAIIWQRNGFNLNPSCSAFMHSYKATQCC